MRKRSPPLPVVTDAQKVAELLAKSRMTPFLYSGMVIRASDFCTRPRMTLSPKLAAIIGYSKPEFVEEMNDWMLEFFGAEDHAYLLTEPGTGRKVCVMSPRAYEQLRKAPSQPEHFSVGVL